MFEKDACAPAEAHDLAHRLMAWAEQLASADTPATHLLEEERDEIARGLATAIKVIRRRHDLPYGGINFGDPTWQVMLDLLVHEMDGRKVSLDGLARAGALPIAAVVDCVQTLEYLGLAVATPEKFDGRFVWVGLSMRARATLFDMLLQAAEFVRPRGCGLPL